MGIVRGADVWTCDCDTHAISDVSQVAKKFMVTGDFHLKYAPGDGVKVVNSTGNDGTYTVAVCAFNGGTGKTEITVNEAIPDPTVDGTIAKVIPLPRTPAIIVDVEVGGPGTHTNKRLAFCDAACANAYWKDATKPDLVT